MGQNQYTQAAGLSYAHISNAGTTVVKARPGFLGAVNINSGTAGATLTVIDSSVASGTTPQIAVLDVGTTTVVPDQVPYGIETNSGIVIVSTGTVDATISFR